MFHPRKNTSIRSYHYLPIPATSLQQPLPLSSRRPLWRDSTVTTKIHLTDEAWCIWNCIVRLSICVYSFFFGEFVGSVKKLSAGDMHALRIYLFNVINVGIFVSKQTPSRQQWHITIHRHINYATNQKFLGYNQTLSQAFVIWLTRLK